MMNYNDYVTIKITKVKDDLGNFLHWESDTQFSENWYEAGSTGPTFYSAVDGALDYIQEVAQYWASNDSNGKDL